MNIQLQKSRISTQKSTIQITGSKSEANRLLILQALYPEIAIENLSNSDDTRLLQKALQTSASISTSIDIHHAGTAMRFLTAYFSSQQGYEVTLTGSKRMKERPIGILVDALRDLGADIQYIENEGFPPLKISGKTLTKHKATLKANVSSQYISALVLIASKLENGLELTLDGKITSVPYINMTLQLLNQIGVETSFKENTINLKPKASNHKPQTLVVESDWSSASYWYSIVALSEVGTKITLASYNQNSLQGDSVLVEIYTTFGVETIFQSNTIVLQKVAFVDTASPIAFNLSNAPDIAQTIAVTAFGLGLECGLSGLHTLKIKETDRLVALQNELSKFGAEVNITDSTLHLKSSETIYPNAQVETYNDHRMAMAFAPLALRTDFTINNADVVSKSYPDFWNDLRTVGFKITDI